jgi:DNA-binding IclR family transcriptional regulator
MRRRATAKRSEEPAIAASEITLLPKPAPVAPLARPREYDDLEAGEGARDRQFVSALARGLEILRAFRPGDGPLGNQDIAQRTGLPKPTVSRLTYTLMKLGHLVYLERLGKYQIGPAVLALGYLTLGNLAIRQIARPHLQALADYANLPVGLGSRDRLSMIYLEACRGRDTLALRLDVGTRIPVASTAMGRAFLAGLPERERDYLLDHIARRHPAEWPRLRRGIEQAIQAVEERGFCASFGEWQHDIYAVGAPLSLPDGAGLMAVNCGGPSFLVARKRLEEELGPRLVSLTRAVASTEGAG